MILINRFYISKGYRDSRKPVEDWPIDTTERW